MDYRCKTGDTETTLTCTTHKDGFSTEIDETPYTVSAAPVDETKLHLFINGRGLLAHVEEIEGGKRVTIDGVPVEIFDADRLAHPPSAPDELPGDVTPPMPSVVVAVLVAPGDQVDKGTPLVTVSAMKMETTLVAPFDARVSAINANPGDQVMPGEILVSLEAKGQEEEKTGTGG
ncbi:acetyl-CoA carboxylase biotin carboxyl carrier protein subunit [Desulfoluna butyratoxydans]|uniref:Single hybrid motif n=1 Tax=Desulfoluna butyratoxydans TaxID=231438 RepID=A0A4V6YUC8_9BACT|nr:biotin/lipoyl-containing protein [Desulfoluna butyratoxydans]VFQ43928.1 single hybrid motif [Desulfoluna butyratoxydans]